MLIQQLYDSINLGVILEEREVSDVLKLMYRMKNPSGRDKDISGRQLFVWLNKEKTKK